MFIHHNGWVVSKENIIRKGGLTSAFEAALHDGVCHGGPQEADVRDTWVALNHRFSRLQGGWALRDGTRLGKCMFVYGDDLSCSSEMMNVKNNELRATTGWRREIGWVSQRVGTWFYRVCWWRDVSVILLFHFNPGPEINLPKQRVVLLIFFFFHHRLSIQRGISSK